MVKYQAWIFPPAASAAFLAASSRAGLSLNFRSALLSVSNQRNLVPYRYFLQIKIWAKRLPLASRLLKNYSSSASHSCYE